MGAPIGASVRIRTRSEEHTSELQSQSNLVCRLLLEKKNIQTTCLIIEVDDIKYNIIYNVTILIKADELFYFTFSVLVGHTDVLTESSLNVQPQLHS